MNTEIIAILLFVVLILVLLTGFPVAFVLGGVSIWAGILFVPDFLDFLPLRIMGTIQNYVLLAVPLFVFMGLTLEKSGIAEDLLQSMGIMFGKVKGGLALSVVLVGTLLAASTGIVGATVISMGLISLPFMLKKNYSVPLATGVIASAGTLGQIIPPSVVLVLLGSVLNVPVGDLFKAAIIPGFMLVAAYILYILGYAYFFPERAPAIPEDEIKAYKKDNYKSKLAIAFLYPMVLIISVLGVIFAGIASPTEAAAVGAFGALFLAFTKKKLTWKLLEHVSKETTYITSMVFMILVGAATFSLVFRGLGGDKLLVSVVDSAGLSGNQFLILVMIVVFIAGFFIDFIEIIFIIVPIVAPVFAKLHMDPLWIGILLALNLQTSFLTPPFGFALFYLKGVAPDTVKTSDMYRGIVPFILIQLLVLALVIVFPEII
ncbi:MAG: TRAP transporter large permease subunit [Saprospiraceae bacterium]|nr:TRAP transporter large permease subunit [Saprospiraceae bacterium]MBP6540607.1 TRAP transporter large permease subunit [Saprospiraceae bacterium]HQV66812.1 TRAP transporter large permease subunit [Saprospiraceae bacterium]